MLHAKEILRAQFARGLGLDRYAEILRGDPASADFQRLFNGYYRVRRNDAWRRHYYALFTIARENRFSFEQILQELFSVTGNVEASFSSKMLATIDPSRPIWDQYVLRNLGLHPDGKTPEERLRNAVALYARIEQWYADYLQTDEAKANINAFDLLLPVYAWISATKKIDCLLWSSRQPAV